MGLVGVQVVLRLARAVHRLRHVEGRRRLTLAILLDRHHDAIGLGQAAEEARSRGEGALRLGLREADELLGVVGAVGRIVCQCGVERIPIRVAEPSRDGVLLRLDPLEVVEAKGVDILWAGLEGCLHADREPIRRLAVRRG